MTEMLILVDGNALVHRAFHAVPPLTTSKGELTNAVYGFASMLLKGMAELHPKFMAVAFDLPAPTFRHKEFQGYKAQRQKGSDELFQQFRRVRQLVDALHIATYQVEGLEADDVLGTLAKQATDRDLETVILTGDADAMQLVTAHVRVLAPRKGMSDTVMYDVEAVRARYGVNPVQIADLKALVGDASDNIPGVPGVGEKTAAKLLGQFETVEHLVEGLDKSEIKHRDLLRAHAAQIIQNKRLTTIVTSAPVELNLEHCRVGSYDRDVALALLRELEFRSLISRLPAVDVEVQPEQTSKTGQMSMFAGATDELAEAQFDDEIAETRYEIIDTIEALDRLISRLEISRGFALDTETDNMDAMRANLVGISVAVEKGEAAYIPVGHRDGWRQLPMQHVLERLSAVLTDEQHPKFAHNAKYDLTVLSRHGIEMQHVGFDSMLGAYLLQATQRAFGLNDLAFSELGVEMTPISDLIGTGKRQLTMAEVDVPKAAKYSSENVDMTLRLVKRFEPRLKQQRLWKLFSEVEIPLVSVLGRMERAGIALDVEYLRKLSAELHRRIVDLEAQIYESTGHRFNINSTQQLAQVLFSELHLDTKRKTKVGESTAANVLEGLRGAHPVVDLILEYRQLVKLKSTYVDALPLLLHPETDRLHTCFNQTGTVTGRLSSSDPNLQNIPIRTELGRKVRRAFVAGERDHVLLSADYSQIELRIMAHIAKDRGLTEAFLSGEDIHAATASQMFGVAIAAVDDDMRRVAKTINFGVMYGISEYGLAERIGIPRREAGEFISKYLDRYEGVRRYVETIKRLAEEQGYVETLLGRRRGIPEIKVEHRGTREAALRTAINMPIQGTAADIIKIAMIRLDGVMRQTKHRAKMLLQVHDELVFEVPVAELPEIVPLVKREMEAAWQLDVPLEVDVKVGRNWAEMERDA